MTTDYFLAFHSTTSAAVEATRSVRCLPTHYSSQTTTPDPPVMMISGGTKAPSAEPTRDYGTTGGDNKLNFHPNMPCIS